jgi:hypothetical protein
VVSALHKKTRYLRGRNIEYKRARMFILELTNIPDCMDEEVIFMVSSVLAAIHSPNNS